MKKIINILLIALVPVFLIASSTIPTLSEIEAKIPVNNSSKGLKWEKGIISGEGLAANGHRHGLWKYSYKKNDNLVKLYEGEYRYGVKTGSWKSFDTDGNLISKDNYVNNLLQGPCLMYYPSGQVSAQVEYTANMKQGRYLEYYEDGKPKEISWYINDMKNGQINYYYPSGNRQFIGLYKNDMKNGKWIYYSNENNKIESQGNYENDKKVGAWTYIKDGVTTTEQH